jgi:pyruvate-formate lyase-activating enzyme
MNYKDNLCPLPWIELSANSDTSLRVCCNTYHGGIVKDDCDQATSITSNEPLVKLFNKKTHRELRQAMIRGEKPSFCNSCYDREDHGGFSTRQSYYHQFHPLITSLVDNTNPDGSIATENLRLKRIDFALSNLCNLKCRMCSPSCSSALKQEFDDIKLGYSFEEYSKAATEWKLNPSFKMIFEHHCQHVESILTTGGEPFISKDHRDILKILKEKNLHSQITLSYHSSLTILPIELIELWRGFKGVNINLSLEGIGKTNDYARFPSKWDNIINNLKILSSLKNEINFSIYVHSCVQAITWPRHHELFYFTKFLNSFDSSIPAIPMPIWLENPSELSALNLPLELKEKGIKKIERAYKHLIRTLGRELTTDEVNFYESYKATFKKLRNHSYKEEDFLLFKERVIAVDIYRHQNITNIIPDFTPYFPQELYTNFINKKDQYDLMKQKEIAFALLVKNDFKMAAQEFRKVWEKHPEDVEACYNIGYCYKNLKRKSEAENFFRQTLALNPSHYFSLIEIAWTEISNKNYDEAQNLFNKALTVEPLEKKGQALEFITKSKKLF